MKIGVYPKQMDAHMFLSDKQVAERFGVTRFTVWRWHRQDKNFPRSVSLSSGCTRWKLDDLEDWERRRAELAA